MAKPQPKAADNGDYVPTKIPGVLRLGNKYSRDPNYPPPAQASNQPARQPYTPLLKPVTDLSPRPQPGLPTGYNPFTKKNTMGTLPEEDVQLAEEAKNPRKLAKGGEVKGPGTATSDSIPAKLSKGEVVIPAKVVKHFGLGTFKKMIAAVPPQLGAKTTVKDGVVNAAASVFVDPKKKPAVDLYGEQYTGNPTPDIRTGEALGKHVGGKPILTEAPKFYSTGYTANPINDIRTGEAPPSFRPKPQPQAQWNQSYNGDVSVPNQIVQPKTQWARTLKTTPENQAFLNESTAGNPVIETDPAQASLKYQGLKASPFDINAARDFASNAVGGVQDPALRGKLQNMFPQREPGWAEKGLELGMNKVRGAMNTPLPVFTKNDTPDFLNTLSDKITANAPAPTVKTTTQPQRQATSVNKPAIPETQAGPNGNNGNNGNTQTGQIAQTAVPTASTYGVNPKTGRETMSGKDYSMSWTPKDTRPVMEQITSTMNDTSGRESAAPVALKDYQKFAQTPVVNGEPTAMIKGNLVYQKSGAPVNPDDLKYVRQLGARRRSTPESLAELDKTLALNADPLTKEKRDNERAKQAKIVDDRYAWARNREAERQQEGQQANLNAQTQQAIATLMSPDYGGKKEAMAFLEYAGRLQSNQSQNQQQANQFNQTMAANREQGAALGATEAAKMEQARNLKEMELGKPTQLNNRKTYNEMGAVTGEEPGGFMVYDPKTKSYSVSGSDQAGDTSNKMTPDAAKAVKDMHSTDTNKQKLGADYLQKHFPEIYKMFQQG